MPTQKNKNNRKKIPLLREGSIARSFNSALEGVVFALKTQRNVKIHFAVTFVVFLASVVLSITKTELILLLLTISLVLVAELFNSAVETVLDIVIERYHPLARVAKDIAAGAVLMAALNAALVGYLIFFERLKGPILTTLVAVRQRPEHLALASFALTIILVFALKALTGRGTFLRGGLPSGHAAVSFGVWAAVSLLTKNPLVSVLVFLLAAMIVVSRVRLGIHSILEVAAGAFLGVGVTAGCFWVLT